MNVASGGLAGVMGTLATESSRAHGSERALHARTAAPSTAAEPKRETGFETGLFRAQAVNAPAKTQNAAPPPNPNLPRGSLIDFSV